MARKPRRSDLDDPHVERPPVDPWPTPSPRPRRLVRRLALPAVIGATAILFAPQIIGRTPLLAKLVAWGAADLRGRIDLDSASLGWLSSPCVEGIQVFDERGEPVARAASVACDRQLWNLVTRPTQLGRIRVERPELELAVRADGTTNLEEVLEKILLAPTTAAFDAAVEIVDGTARICDEATGRRWTLEGLDGVFIWPSDSAAPTSFDGKASIVSGNSKQPIRVHAVWRDAAESGGPPKPQGEASLAAGAFPLELVQAFVRRFAPGIEVGGTATADVGAKFDFAGSPPTASIAGRVGLFDLAVGGSALAGDQIRLAQVDVPIRAALAGDRLTIEEFGAACELASVAATGSIERYQRLLTAAAPSQWLDVLTGVDGRATAQADLAKIAQTMPHLLRLRDDVQLTGGDLALTIAGDRDAQAARRWRIDLTTSGLKAVRGGAPLAWEEPIRASLEARDSPSGPIVERAACQSDFLVVNGSNTAKSFDLTAQYDLQRLVDRLAQFVDLGGVQLRGNGTAQAAWVRLDAERFDVEATASIAGFQLSLPGLPTWTEPQLAVGLQAVGRAAGLSVAAVEQGAVGLDAGEDRLTATLTEPVADVLRSGAIWPLKIEGRGNLATWLARVRPFLNLPGVQSAEGRAELFATARVRGFDDFEILESRAHVAPLRIAAPPLAVDEAAADVTLAGRYETDRWEIREGLLTTPSAVAQVRNFLYATPLGRLPECTGEAGFRADVARLRGMFGPVAADALQVGGLLEGVAKMQRTGTVVAASLDAHVKELTLAQGGKIAWREPQVRVVGSGIYDPLRDFVGVDRLEIAGDGLRVLLDGKVNQVSTVRMVELKGEAAGDLSRLNPVLRRYAGDGVSIAGQETQRFELTGPLRDSQRSTIPWEQLGGAGRLAWDQLDLYGFLVGKQGLEARLNQGLLTVNPLVVPIGAGRVRLAPSLRMTADRKELLHEPGLLVDHVTITPEMADRQLKYVVPILAGVAQVSGAFSVAVDQLRLPLDDPAAGEIAGKLTVHAVDVGPGYLTQELAALLKQPLKVGLTRESTVDFKMIQGRIYHQNLEFAFPGVTVRTYGSVGLTDQSLSMMAETQVSAQQFGLDKLPVAQAAVAGTTIRLPITGTLTKPTIDARGLVQATGETLRNAAEGALQEGINRGLNRLLGPSGSLLPNVPR